MCEINKTKQKYLAQAFPGALLFEDMAEVGNGRAKECSTGNYVEVPKALIHIFDQKFDKVGVGTDWNLSRGDGG